MPARVPITLVGVAVAAVTALALVGLDDESSPAEPIRATAAASGISVYPSPGSKYASPTTQISLRGASPSALRGVTVRGSSTGTHSGTLEAHSDGRGASIVPDLSFANGETVTVSVGRHVAGVSGNVATFRVSTPLKLSETPQGRQFARQRVESFKTRPDLQPPRVKINTKRAGTSPGDFFVAPKAGSSQAGPMIVDGSGHLVWFHPLDTNLQAFSFDVAKYHGKRVLTWWQGHQSGGHGLDGVGMILDGNYHPIARVVAGNGFDADMHEFKLTPRGTAFLLAYNPVRANLKSVGGPSEGVAFDAVVQEIDVKTGLVLFEWHSLDHVPLTDSHQHFEQGQPYDFFHVNSADDIGNDVLISARATWTVYRIDRATGRVVWRLGGKHNSFKMGHGAHFSWQHDAHSHGESTISLFDNHAVVGRSDVESAGLMLKLDTVRRRATLVHAYRHPESIVSPSQANLQILSNGHAIIGWGGGNRNFSEFSAGGKLLFDAYLDTPRDNSYRAFRGTWSGFAPGNPAVVATTAGGLTKVSASWNGATKVAKWRVLAGPTADALIAVNTFPRTDFETTMTIQTPQAFVVVEALSAQDKVLGRSAPAASKAG